MKKVISILMSLCFLFNFMVIAYCYDLSIDNKSETPVESLSQEEVYSKLLSNISINATEEKTSSDFMKKAYKKTRNIDINSVRLSNNTTEEISAEVVTDEQKIINTLGYDIDDSDEFIATDSLYIIINYDDNFVTTTAYNHTNGDVRKISSYRNEDDTLIMMQNENGTIQQIEDPIKNIYAYELTTDERNVLDNLMIKYKSTTPEDFPFGTFNSEYSEYDMSDTDTALFKAWFAKYVESGKDIHHVDLKDVVLDNIAIDESNNNLTPLSRNTMSYSSAYCPPTTSYTTRKAPPLWSLTIPDENNPGQRKPHTGATFKYRKIPAHYFGTDPNNIIKNYLTEGNKLELIFSESRYNYKPSKVTAIELAIKSKIDSLANSVSQKLLSNIIKDTVVTASKITGGLFLELLELAGVLLDSTKTALAENAKYTFYNTYEFKHNVEAEALNVKFKDGNFAVLTLWDSYTTLQFNYAATELAGPDYYGNYYISKLEYLPSENTPLNLIAFNQTKWQERADIYAKRLIQADGLSGGYDYYSPYTPHQLGVPGFKDYRNTCPCIIKCTQYSSIDIDYEIYE